MSDRRSDFYDCVRVAGFGDRQCLKYKTRSSIILNRFDAFTHSVMQKMQNRPAPLPSSAPTPQQSSGVAAAPTNTNIGTADRLPAVTAAAADAAATQTSAATAGVKKKKQKKKK